MRKQLRRVSLLSFTLPALVAGFSFQASAQGYRVYGQEIEAQEKNPAVEECEYRELVEDRRCNESINKSDCISEVHKDCLLRFGDAPSAEEPDREEPR